MSEPHVVHVGDLIADKKGIYRWAVIATFTGVTSGQARCIEYRIRVVPATPSVSEAAAHMDADNYFNGYQVLAELEKDTSRKRKKQWSEAESDSPAEGIPRWVFEQASQSRMLAKAREYAENFPERVQSETARLLANDKGPRRGRPPVRSLTEKLRILQAVESAFIDGRTIGDVALDEGMSRSSLRDLLAWARSGDSGAVLFTGGGPGKRGGQLTAAAREMLSGSE